LAIEDKSGKRDMIPQKGGEDQFVVEYEDDELVPEKEEDFVVTAEPQKKEVIKRCERYSNEL
jgi:hypothetical protein